MFGRKRRQIEALETQLDEFDKANKQIAEEYQVLLDDKIRVMNNLEERTLQVASLKQEAGTREAQIEAMKAMREADTLRIEALKDVEDQVGTLLSQQSGLEDLLGEAQDALTEMEIDRNNTHTRLRDANRLLDATNEWIGEFAKRCLSSGRVSLSDLEAIRDGWEQPDGRYPWEE